MESLVAGDMIVSRPEGDPAALPSLVASLVSREVPVYGAVPRPPTVEEIYFALQDREKS